jgi:superoxide reductase
LKGLVCKVCGYVALDGNNGQCPVCHLRNAFEEKEDAYHMPGFKAASGESEKKHIPAFTVVNECGLIPVSGCTADVHVKIGEILHPSAPEHHITEITFYLDNKFIAHVIIDGRCKSSSCCTLKERYNR